MRITPPQPVRGLLLDMDGVLVDSQAVHREAWAALFREQGVDFGPTRFRDEAAGRSRDDILRAVLGQRSDLPALMARKAALVDERIASGGCGAMPGARDLIEEARRRGLPIAVATASRMPEPFLRAAGLAELLPIVRHRGDVARGKPAPDVYLAAAAALDLPCTACIAVEDSPSGIDAARAAGCFTLAIPTTHDPTELNDADVVIAELTELWSLVDAASPTP